MIHFLFFILVSIPLKNRKVISSNSPIKISKHDHAWYYFYLKNKFNIPNFISTGIQKKDILPISDGFFTGYISKSDAEKLNEFHNIWVKKIPSSHKEMNENNNKSSNMFYVFSSKNCDIPGKIIQSFDDFSVVSFKFPQKAKQLLSKVKCIRAFESVNSKMHFNARFDKAFTYKSVHEKWRPKMDIDFSNNIIPSELNGSGECVVIADTGIDVNNMWFYDDLQSSNIKNKNFHHRKIRFTLPYGDYVDNDGHGTFVAGIVAGDANCSREASRYNGVAPKAKILIEDLQDENGNFVLPSNLSEVHYFSKRLGCTVQLNSWVVQNQPLLTFLIDKTAYENPDMLLIFGADKDNVTGTVSTPADAKNVLTVGATFSHIASSSFADNRSSVLIYPFGLNKPIPAFLDSQGTSLFRSKVSSEELLQLTIDATHQSACIMEADDDWHIFKNCSVILLFHDDPISHRFKKPVIRMPSRWRKSFIQDLEFSVVPLDLDNDGHESPLNLRPESAKESLYSFRIKPELVAPGGPMAGPKANSSSCGHKGLTSKSGPSVAAALVAGDALLISQWLHNKMKKSSIHSTLLRALLIYSANSPKSNKEYSVLEGNEGYSGFGYGIPQIETIISENPFMYTGKLNSNEAIFFSLKTKKSGSFSVVVSFLDHPKDPLSIRQISANFQVYLKNVDNSETVEIPNQAINQTDFYDFQNTNMRITANVKFNQMYQIILMPFDFEHFNEITYSMVVSNGFGTINGPNDYLSQICPKPCKRRGLCVNGRCECVGNTFGDFCDSEVHYLVNGENYVINSMTKGRWEYFSLKLNDWTNGSQILINYSKLDTENVNIHLWFNEVPTLSKSFCSLHRCNWGRKNNGSLILKYDDWEFVSSDPLFIGVFALRPSNYKNIISVDVKKTEQGK